MAAARTALLAALAVVLAAHADATYTTVVQKAPTGIQPADAQFFSIPPGQCTANLNSKLKCLYGRPALGVRVSVDDEAAYPSVNLADSLQTGSVVRAYPCVGEAQVTIKLACYVSDNSGIKANAKLPPV